jgi:outer membrane protein assembly factor BamB
MDLRRILKLAVGLIGSVALLVILGMIIDSFSGTEETDEAQPATATSTTPTTLAPDTSTTSTTVDPASFGPWSDPAGVSQPPDATTPGLLTFRGNPTRTFHGLGPVPREQPDVLWSYPDAPLCGSNVETGTQRCGTAWTGQPAVFEFADRTWVGFGGYDGAIHLVDANSGRALLPAFPTGDWVKASVSVDPDSFPLLYVGSNDGNFRILAFDRPEITELWSINSLDFDPALFSDDWDASALIIDDYLFQGAENGQFMIVKLNRGTGDDGLVTVAPERVFSAPAWDDQLILEMDDNNVSIESSMTVVGNTMYFANSQGLVQSWDITAVRGGGAPTQLATFWTGDDTDTTIVVDESGMLYVGATFERGQQRAQDVGQFMKLDPALGDAALIWSVKDLGADFSGVLGTAALHGDVVIVPFNGGRLDAFDRNTGEVRWSKQLTGPLWSSPAVVDNVLIQADCAGDVIAYDVTDPTIDPPEIWRINLGGCIASTPAVWNGVVYVGAEDGFMRAIGVATGEVIE